MEQFIIGVGEIFRKDKNEIIEYGDIVCVGEDGLIHKVSCEEDLSFVVGICSDTIGFVLGSDNVPEDEQLEVEMLGQIWVKTDDLDIKPRMSVSALPNGKVCKFNGNKVFGIALTKVINGKVRIFFDGYKN